MLATWLVLGTIGGGVWKLYSLYQESAKEKRDAHWRLKTKAMDEDSNAVYLEYMAKYPKSDLVDYMTARMDYLKRLEKQAGTRMVNTIRKDAELDFNDKCYDYFIKDASVYLKNIGLRMTTNSSVETLPQLIFSCQSKARSQEYSYTGYTGPFDRLYTGAVVSGQLVFTHGQHTLKEEFKGEDEIDNAVLMEDIDQYAKKELAPYRKAYRKAEVPSKLLKLIEEFYGIEPVIQGLIHARQNMYSGSYNGTVDSILGDAVVEAKEESRNVWADFIKQVPNYEFGERIQALIGKE